MQYRPYYRALDGILSLVAANVGEVRAGIVLYDVAHHTEATRTNSVRSVSAQETALVNRINGAYTITVIVDWSTTLASLRVVFMT